MNHASPHGLRQTRKVFLILLLSANTAFGMERGPLITDKKSEESTKLLNLLLDKLLSLEGFSADDAQEVSTLLTGWKDIFDINTYSPWLQKTLLHIVTKKSMLALLHNQNEEFKACQNVYMTMAILFKGKINDTLLDGDNQTSLMRMVSSMIIYIDTCNDKKAVQTFLEPFIAQCNDTDFGNITKLCTVTSDDRKDIRRSKQETRKILLMAALKNKQSVTKF